MSYLGEKNFLVEVQKGNVAGHAIVHKFGRNDTVPNGTWEFVNLLGFTGWPLSAATTVRVKAGGNAADTAAGNGAREITVTGIDDSFNEVSEAIATAGASASSATTALFWRVYRAKVTAVGTYGAANTAAVTLENGGGGADLIQIAVEEGQSQFAGWTVPIGKTAYLLSFTVTIDANKPATIAVYTRENIDDVSAPMSSKQVKLHWEVVVGTFEFEPRSPGIAIPAKTDIWVEAKGGGASTEVSADFELLVVDD